MYRLTDGEVNFLRNTIDETLDLLRNGEDGDGNEEDMILTLEVAIDMLDSLNYHDTQVEVDLIEEEEQEDTDAT